MATLKQHQAEMVKLLATGSGIPASASRLAHAMHDVLKLLLDGVDHAAIKRAYMESRGAFTTDAFPALRDATTPGLNEKALSKHVTATKTDSHATRPAPAEIRVKELQNTIRQLKENNAKLKGQYASCFKSLEEATLDCQNLQHRLDCARKPDTQVCEHEWVQHGGQFFASCAKCGAICAKCGAIS